LCAGLPVASNRREEHEPGSSNDAGAEHIQDRVLRDVVAEPCWGYGMRAGREREAARWDRKQEEEQEQKPGQSGRDTAGRMKAASNA